VWILTPCWVSLFCVCTDYYRFIKHVCKFSIWLFYWSAFVGRFIDKKFNNIHWFLHKIFSQCIGCYSRVASRVRLFYLEMHTARNLAKSTHCRMWDIKNLRTWILIQILYSYLLFGCWQMPKGHSNWQRI
jgi:hypothetical protein